ncbi:MAG: glycosyltransferase family A protein [Acetobacteraceae bacterium]
MTRHRSTVSDIRPSVVVAVPARDEEDRLAACLGALDQQTSPPNAVVLLLNNCTDASDAVARAVTPRYDLRVVSIDLPSHEAGAGPARALAMQHAARLAGPSGILLTTDADATVPTDWVQRNLAALDAGADVVCGQSVVHAIEGDQIPQHLHDDDVLERRLDALIDEMAWRLNPDPDDPPPRHTEEAGASLAVRVSAWRQAGGVPPVATGEDRAFVAALRRIDAHIRHDPDIAVVVSGRINGRAAGGMADAIRRRIVVQDEFTDATQEPPDDALRRLALQARCRAAWAGRSRDATLAADLGVTPDWLQQVLSRPFFGAAWGAIGAAGVLARRHRVRFVDLPRHIARAEMLLAQIAAPGTLAAD